VRRRRRKALDALAGAQRDGLSVRLGPALAARVGRRLPLPASTRASLVGAAGSRADEVAGSKVVLAAGGAVVGILLSRPPLAFATAPLFAAAGWKAPNISLDRRDREREDIVRHALPDALDLLAACALAGMGIDQALRIVAAETTGPLGDALTEMVRRLDAGVTRTAAYETLAREAQAAEVRSLVRALRRAERYGTPVAPVLVAQAREVRTRRRISAEEAARAAPVRMLFPLVLCFLPAFVLLTVAPIVLTALRSFRTP
jgi:tight adherence protein C